MKWFVKILAVVLVLCILLTLFVACKKKGDETTEDESNTEQSGGGTPQLQDGDADAAEGTEDMAGETHQGIVDDTLPASQFDN